VTRELRIAIDLRPLALDHGGGVGLFVSQVLEELSTRGCSFLGLSDRAIDSGVLPRAIPVLVGGRAGRRIRWEAGVLPGLLRSVDPAPDLYHAAWNHGVPRGLPFPSVVTIYDLIPWRVPEAVPWPKPARLHQFLYRRAVRSSARASVVISTISETSRKDIAALIPDVAARTEVTPCALPRWFTAADPARGFDYRRRFGGSAYWLYLGGFDPRKGISTLLDAMSRLSSEGITAPDLVLAGPRNEAADRHAADAARMGLRVHFPGYVPDAELPALFAGASLFVYPSVYEGFGIPLLFAMASGTPCVVSDGGSIPEVIGEAGIVFPAGDAAALAARLARAAAEPGSLSERAARGPERARRFSVDALAERMLRVYERAARSRAGSA
jgi:glycosyltransferase involved in cell wall biosynthesis